MRITLVGIAFALSMGCSLSMAQDAPAADAKKADFVPATVAPVEQADAESKIAAAVVKAEIDKQIAEEAHDTDPSVNCVEGGRTTIEIDACSAREFRIAAAEMRGYFAVARARFVASVNDEFNADSDADKKSAIAEFDEAQSAWLKFRDAHCNSVYYNWQSGTIRGYMLNRCMLQSTRVRTRLIWEEWLRYMDSSPPVLPEPPTGFE